jgi:hypothetical protein
MAFTLPMYHPPDFTKPPLKDAPLVRFAPVVQKGVAPEGYHATSIFPEYYQLDRDRWVLLAHSRMDCVVVKSKEGPLMAREFHHLEAGEQVALGHYHHLDAINQVLRAGSLARAMETGLINDGVMHALWEKKVPYVLAGSIRDDGPLPEVITDVMAAQDAMRALTSRATTVIAVATQLHSIAAGNMIPGYHVLPDGKVRPVYFYVVDMSEFAAGKLTNRGSLAARPILTNAQDFLVILERGLGRR